MSPLGGHSHVGLQSTGAALPQVKSGKIRILATGGKAVPDGDPFCELTYRDTGEQDKKELRKPDTNFKAIEARVRRKTRKK